MARTDRSRFEALALPYLDRLLGAARRWMGSREAAEDLVQETYLRAWRHFGSLADETRVHGWLQWILRRTAADHFRREARRSTLLPITDLEADYEALVAASDPGPLETLIAALERARLDELLLRLPTECAEALALHDLDGFRYRDIAAITGAPIGTVMSRIHRARRLLVALAAREDRADRDGLRRARRK